MQNDSTIKDSVKKHYGEIARGKSSCCGSTSTSCCGPNTIDAVSLAHGYAEKDLTQLPDGADLGLGCGNPGSLVEIQPGWRVLDLGSGAGIDVFMAAKRVGPSGQVTGLDMTDEMLEKAWENARKGGYTNVSFIKGEIETMPFADGSFDLVISNCVINLVPDKARAYREIHRVLKPGGQLAIADMAVRGEMPAAIRKSMEEWAGCVAGALELERYLAIVREVGFVDVGTKFVNEYDYARNQDYALLSIGLVGRKA